MTTECKLLAPVEIVCRQIGYGRVIQAIHARWALLLHKDGMPLQMAVMGALITDPHLTTCIDDAELLRRLNVHAGHL